MNHLDHWQAEHLHAYFNRLAGRSNQRRGGGLSNNYLNKHRGALVRFHHFLHQQGRTDLPLVELQSFEREAHEINPPTLAEIKALYAVTEQPAERAVNQPEGLNEWLAVRDRAMLAVYYACGLRRSEGQALNLSDIDFNAAVLHVRKGKNYRERLVPLSASAKHDLQSWVYDWRGQLAKDPEALLLSARGRRANAGTLNLRLHQLQQRSELADFQQKPLSLHTLRHAIASHLLAAGMELEKISRFLGHSSLESTQLYTHLSAETREGGFTAETKCRRIKA